MSDSERIVIQLSALEKHQYCERQAVLVHGDGVWIDNRHTVKGRRGHRRADGGADRRERGVSVHRGVAVHSAGLGLTGRCDVVEVTETGEVRPVEYKIGRRHGRAAEVQLCAQAMCLEEMLGVEIGRGFTWHSGPRRRREVPLDAELRAMTIDVIERLRDQLAMRSLPVAPADERCEECQLIGHCLPYVVAAPERVLDHVLGLFTCS